MTGQVKRQVNPILMTNSGGAQALSDWQACFARLMPELDVRAWGDPEVPPDQVRYALVWQPERGGLARYRNLRLAISAGAGVEHILADDQRPAAVPVVRLVLPETRQGMAEYVAMGTLMLMRDMRAISLRQQQHQWLVPTFMPLAQRTRVGVMGLGALGDYTARYLAGMGFEMLGWSRSAKSIDGVATFHGMDQLPRFLGQCDVLVNLLPQTPETTGLLDSGRLAMLPRGASLLNAGRGPHVVNADLLRALDDGHLHGAMLDVFEREPLAQDSPLWNHPKVTVTPHAASTPSRADRARQVAHIIGLAEAGEPIPDLYDPVRGY